MDDFQQVYTDLMEAFSDFKRLVQQKDRVWYERWKAGGFLVDEDVLSMYPTATAVFEALHEQEEEEAE